MTRSRRNPDATFTVFHADHGVSPEQMDFIKATLAHEAPQGFFIKEIMLPRSLGMARNALYGPAAGDAPVAESAVSYRPRGDRPWSDRVVSWPTRPTDRVQAIGIREGDNFKLFTVYGGYLAPQHPDDPANPNVEAAKRFWSQHALSIEQWDAPGTAKRNPRSSGAVMTRARRNPELRPSPFGKSLAGMDLSGQDLSYMDLSGAKLTSADLRGANLVGANLSGAHLSGAELTRANLSGADLSGANLVGANLVDVDLSGAVFSNAKLTGADLGSANLSGANLVGADLSGVSFFGTFLTRADLSNAKLTGANLSNADLTGANLTGANLSGANLLDVNLEGAGLTRANLSEADLSGAHLRGAYLLGANLTGAKLTDAKLEGAIGLGQAKRNPFFVSPGGAAAKVSDADFAARKFPKVLEREVKIEGFDPSNLPPGFTVEKDGSHYRVFFQGRDTGLYATDLRKAAEIVSRKGANVASGTAPKAAAGRPSGAPSDRPLFGVDRDTLTPHSRAGDLAAAEELRLRGRDPMTGAKVSGLASRFSKAVPNGRMRR